MIVQTFAETLLERLGREAVDEDAEPTQSYITALRVTVRTLEKETDQREVQHSEGE